ncbi:MAG: 30S ribosomal protein S4 [Tissierella sp.]|nr:30S ribosomal protein S4 [Tissierella sp.]
MSRYTGPVCRLCRREGMKLYLKGDRCYSDRCAITKRNYAPGQHGQGRKKVTEYGLQLREKQKVRRFYGINESQMVKYFNMADNMKGITGDNLLKLLESRLDNVVYRMGFGASRAEARQLVTHGHFLLNGEKATIPSMIISVGDVISVKGKSKNSEKIKELVENNNGNTVSWLNVDLEQLKGTIIAEPTREDIDIPIEDHLIVELYSR